MTAADPDVPLPERPSVWVCLPTYDERENIEPMIRAVGDEFAAHDMDGTLLVIDDNSPDGTGEIADRLALDRPWLRVLHRQGKEGLGKAYVAGFKEALAGGADLVLEMDCDFSHDPKDLHRLVIGAGRADLVLGSRYVAGGGVRNWPLSRRFISRGGSLYARTILGVDVRDLTGGFKCFRRRVLETLDLDAVGAHGYMFQIELTFRTLRAGFTVREVPIVFTDRVHGASKMNSSIVREAIWRVWLLRVTGSAG